MRIEQQTLNGFRVVDLFAGIGGFHQAVESFGAEVIYASEWDKDAAAVYETNYQMKPVGDITKIDEKTIPDHEILCAGFPCQAFSISGNRKGFEDSRGTLFFDVARIAKCKKPKILLLENVKNFEVHDGGNTLKVVLKTLDEIGYSAFYKVLDASQYGIPHSRKRIYFVCFRKDLGVTQFDFPKPIKLEKHVQDMLEGKDAKAKVLNQKERPITIKKEAKKFDSKPIRIGTVGKGGQGERIYSPKGTAITLSAYGGGVGSKTGLYKIGTKVRKLTPRECARLQGFPDTFILPQNDNHAYKQFGNSVVIDVLQCLIESIIEQHLSQING